MQIVNAGLRDVKLLSPQRHSDSRGWFAETFSNAACDRAGLPASFAQDNQSFSHHGVLRGLHYQQRQPQGKLLRVLTGRIWDLVVDLRQSSPDFGRWEAFELQPLSDDGSLQMLWIPEGFAHGFLVLSPSAEVLYKVTRPYDPGGEHTILWNDPQLAIDWPLDRLQVEQPLISAKDMQGVLFKDAALFA